MTAGWDRLRKLVIFLVFTSIFLISPGCRTTMHPITDFDCYPIEKGAVVKHTDGSETVNQFDGWFYSNFYISEIVNAKAEK